MYPQGVAKSEVFWMALLMGQSPHRHAPNLFINPSFCIENCIRTHIPDILSGVFINEAPGQRR